MKSEEVIREQVRKWLILFNSKNAEEFFELFHPDAIYADPKAPLMRGLDEIKPWYLTAFEMMTGRVLFKEEAIVVEGNMGFAVGKFYVEPSEKDAPVGETGRVTLIYRRVENGDWLLAFDMGNLPPDSKPEDFADAGESAYLQ